VDENEVKEALRNLQQFPAVIERQRSHLLDLNGVVFVVLAKGPSLDTRPPGF
jgi:hypothetical protein